MPQAQLQDPIEEQPEIVPGTEGTEYEGMSEEDIERAEFDKAIKDDSDIEDPPDVPVVEPVADDPEPDPEPRGENDPDPEPGGEADPEPKTPTGLEWLDTLPDDARATAQKFIDGQGQAIARLDQRVKSHLGQLQPAQRAVTTMQRKLADLQGKLNEQQPKDVDIEARTTAYNDWVDQEYKEFPEEAAKLKTRFRESLDGIPEVLTTATPESQPAQPAGPDPTAEVHHLATAYSDWGERRFSPEFDQWIARQQPETAQLLNSPFASDNVALLDAFTHDHPEWTAPQTPDQFHSLAQAQHSPLFRGWAEGEGISPDMNIATVPDFQRDMILTRFKTDLGAVLKEQEQAPDPKSARLAERRSEQLKDRNPGSRRTGVTPGQKIDLNTDEGQRAYFQQLVDADPDH